MFKNPNTKQIAIFTSAVLALFYLIVISFMQADVLLENKLLIIFLSSLVFFAISYFTFYQLIKNFIYNRIRVIYKNIQKNKVESKENQKDYLMKDNIMDEVENDVEDWLSTQQKELADLKKLEEYRRSYLGNISHELKTPVFNIQGYIHTLLDGALYDEDINEDYLRKAAKNTERLQVILEDLDAISKLESGELVLDIQKFNIRDLVMSVYEELGLIAKKNKINLGFKDGAENDFIVLADQENIRKVLNNLVINGIKYGKEGGDVNTSFYDMDSSILIEVSDNGIGIEAHHLSHVFDRFYRVDKHRSRIKGGSGLGLAIVKHVLEAHKQRITSRSTLGIGSTFGFTLTKA